MKNQKLSLDSKPRKTVGFLRGKHLTGQAKSMIRVNSFLNPSLSVIITAVFAVVIIGVLGFGESVRAANYPLEIINIKPAGTGSPAISPNNRIFRAYPGIEYNIRPAVIGGLYPYNFSLSNAPGGMSIDNATGEISWPNPSGGSYGPITLSVTDSENTTITTSWSITVSTNGFLFVDASYGGTESGSITQPYNSIQDLLDLSGHENDIVYFRTGTYHVPTFHGTFTEWNASYGCSLHYNDGAPHKWIEYPSEAAIIDMDDHFIEIDSVDNNDAYFDGFEFVDMAGYGIFGNSGCDYFTLRKCDFHGIAAPMSANGNWGFVYFNHGGGTGHCKVFQNCKFHDYSGTAAIGSIYYSNRTLIEDCEFYDQHSGLCSIKSAICAKYHCHNLSVRHNIFHDIHYGHCIGHSTNSSLLDSSDIEVCFNLFNCSSPHNGFNTHSSTERLYYYRNTVLGTINFSNSTGAILCK